MPKLGLEVDREIVKRKRRRSVFLTAIMSFKKTQKTQN